VVPPRIHFFRWLLSNNRLLARDNFRKKRKVEDQSCLFCNESESIDHLFFGCSVATQEIIGFPIGQDYESIASCWLCNKKFGVVNSLTSAVCWGLWKLRNSLCF
jgi:predicted HTH transcriptional regulator